MYAYLVDKIMHICIDLPAYSTSREVTQDV
jgi:hypothetical protein